MKKLIFVVLTFILCFSIHYSVFAETTTNDIDKLYKRFDICPVASCLKGNNLYVLTGNGPENEPKYGTEPDDSRSGSEIGYYNLNSGVYTKLFTKYYEDTTMGAINSFSVDDAQENINFTEQVCVGQIHQIDEYIVTYSIKSMTAHATYFPYFGIPEEEYQRTLSQVYDKEYFRYTDKIASLLKKEDPVLRNTSNARFGGNNKLFVIKDIIDGSIPNEDVYLCELGYIDLDSDSYIKLFQKRENSKKSIGEIKLLSARGNEIAFQDYTNFPGSGNDCGYITYSYTVGKDTISITDSRYIFHKTFDRIDSLIGKKLKTSEFKDIGQYSIISGLSYVYKKFPGIREVVIVNNKLFVLISKYSSENEGGHEFGSIDLKTFKYTVLLQKSKENSEKFNGYFSYLHMTKGLIEFADNESAHTKANDKNFYATINYGYSPEKNMLEIRDSFLNTNIGNAYSQIKFYSIIGSKIRLKDFKDIEYYFNLSKILDFVQKYPSIKDVCISNNRLYTISYDGLNKNSFDSPTFASEIGYFDLKTNRYTKLLKKAKASNYSGELSFLGIAQNKIEFFDCNRDSCTAVNYELSLSDNSLKVTDISPGSNENNFNPLIGKKLKSSEFKDIDQFLNLTTTKYYESF